MTGQHTINLDVCAELEDIHLLPRTIMGANRIQYNVLPITEHSGIKIGDRYYLTFYKEDMRIVKCFIGYDGGIAAFADNGCFARVEWIKDGGWTRIQD